MFMMGQRFVRSLPGKNSARVGLRNELYLRKHLKM